MSESEDAVGNLERRMGTMEECVMNALEEMPGWKDAVEGFVRRMERERKKREEGWCIKDSKERLWKGNPTWYAIDNSHIATSINFS